MKIFLTLLAMVLLNHSVLAAEKGLELLDTDAVDGITDINKLAESLAATKFDEVEPAVLLAAYRKFDELAGKSTVTADTLKKMAKAVKDQVGKMETAFTQRKEDGLKGDALTKLRSAVNNFKVFPQKLTRAAIDKLSSGTPSADLTAVLGEGMQAEDRITALSAKIDNTMLGEYMKQKMEGLLASKQFCVAVKECAGENADKNYRKRRKLDPLFDGKGGPEESVHEAP